MNLFAFVNISFAILSAGLAIFMLLQARNRVHYVWSLFNAIVSIWGFQLFWVGISKNEQQAIFHWQWMFALNTFIPILLYHFIHYYCNLKQRWILYLLYLEGALFSPTILLTNYFVNDIEILFGKLYYFKPTELYYSWLFLLALISVFSFFRFFNYMWELRGEKKREALYFFWSMLVGFCGGFTLAFPSLGIHIYPVWHFVICAYAIVITFAILRYKFFDIHLTLLRLSIPFLLFIIALFVFCFSYFEMNLFAITSLSLAVVCFLLAYIISCYAKNKIHWIWALFNIAVGIYGGGLFGVGVSKTYNGAFLNWKIALFGVANIGMLFYLVVHHFCKLSDKRMLRFVYIHGILFSILSLTTPWVVNSLRYVFNEFYYCVAGIAWNTLFPIWAVIVVKAFVELYKHMQRSTGTAATQSKYLFYGMLIGFLGGASPSLPAWKIDLYPFWHFLICIYAAISTYAIFKYQLMDIRIAVTRVGIFVFVYSLIWGIPFGVTFWGKEILINVFGQHWHWAPIILSTVFATAGPFVFLYFQRKAEDALLQEEQRTQDLLMQASYGMNTIHRLQKLLDLMVTIVVRTLRVDGGKIFLLNHETDKYELRVPAGNSGLVFNRDDPLAEYLRQKQYPVVHDEMKILSEMNGEIKLKEVEARMRGLSAHLIVPITLNNSLLGFLVLGERDSKDMYSKGLLNALSVLGHQAAIAIDRCIYLEAEAKRLEEEGLKERILSLDHMASSMAHEIDNPMHSISMTTGFIRNQLIQDPRIRYLPEEILSEFRTALDRIIMAGERVSGIVKAILDYSKLGKGKGEFRPVNIKEAVEGFSYLIDGEIKKEKVRLDIQAEDNLHPILGDRIQLEEIFVNFVRNAIHAVKHKPREDRRIILKIFKKDYKTIRIECIDNGYGIEKNLLKDIFLANVTTKGSSEGTGLGLHRVRKIVDAFGGRVWGESEGKDKGATLIVELPSYDGDKIAQMDILNPDKEKKGKDKEGEEKDKEDNG